MNTKKNKGKNERKTMYAHLRFQQSRDQQFPLYFMDCDDINVFVFIFLSLCFVDVVVAIRVDWMNLYSSFCLFSCFAVDVLFSVYFCVFLRFYDERECALACLSFCCFFSRLSKCNDRNNEPIKGKTMIDDDWFVRKKKHNELKNGQANRNQTNERKVTNKQQ